MQNEIARSARNTIGDGLRRSARRDPEKTAIVFGERSWPYAELDDAANRAANALLEKGIKKGDRVAAYGRNSDAYVIHWLACARAGLIHVPINFALGGDELHCILEPDCSRMLLHDTPLAEAAEEVRDRAGVETVGTLHGGNGFDLILSAREGDASEPEWSSGRRTPSSSSTPRGPRRRRKGRCSRTGRSCPSTQFVSRRWSTARTTGP